MNEQETVQVGSIFYSSWGYDQTNVDWYQVTKQTPKGVYVREIAGKGVEGTGGNMCQNVVPVKDSFLTDEQVCGGKGNAPKFHRLSKDGKSFSVKSYANAYLWDGKPKYESWYH